nr:transmembrane protein 33 [Hymenolepis microstoma]
MSASPSGQSVRAFLTSDWSNTLTYATRLITIISCVFYFFGSFYGNPYSWYQRALIANAATSALRLHQRITRQSDQLRLSQETIATIVSEDSLHYLLYSLMFLWSPPVTVALAPIFCFAFLHCLGFTKNLLTSYGSVTTPPPSWVTRLLNLISKAQGHNENVLRIIAVHEVILMVVTIVLAFSGHVIFLAFFYYQFLKMRYASRRNPYCRLVFSELRVAFTRLSNHPSCPQFAKSLINTGINFVSRLNPAAHFSMAHNGPIGSSGYRSEHTRYVIDRDESVQISEHRQHSSSSFGPTIKRPADDEFDVAYQPVLKKEKVFLLEKSQPGYLSSNKCEEVCAKSPSIPQSAIQRNITSASNFPADSDINQEIAGLFTDPKPSSSCPDSLVDAKSTSSSDMQNIKRSPYVCDICKSIFQTKQKWKNHMDTHDSSKRYQCTAAGCGRSFTSQKYLDNHKADHFCRGLECIICDYVGKNKIDIKGHFKQYHLRDVERNTFTAEWNDVKDIFERNIQEILGGHPVQSPINYNLFESITTTGNGEQFSPDGTNSTMSVPSFRDSGGLGGNGAGNLTSPPPPLSTGTNSVSPSRNSCSSGFIQNLPSSDFLEPQFPSVIEQPPQQLNTATKLDQSHPTRSSSNDGSNFSSTAPNFPHQIRNTFDENWETQSYSQSNLPSAYNLPSSSYRQHSGDNATTWMYQMPQEPPSHQYHATSSNASSQPPQTSASLSFRYGNNNTSRQQSVNTFPSYQEEGSFNYGQQQQVIPRNSYQQAQQISNQYQRSYCQNYYQQEYYPQQNLSHLHTYCQQTPQRHRAMNTQSRLQHPQMMRAVDEVSTSFQSMPQQIYNSGSQQQQQVVNQHFTNSWSYSNTKYYNHQSQPNVHSSDFQATAPAATVPQFTPTEY